MLSRGSKLFVLLIILVLNSCNDSKLNSFEEVSRKISGSEYDKVYNYAYDSIKLWASLNLVSYDENSNGFILDKTMCFNNSVNKCVMSLSQQDMDRDRNADYMQFFYGAKIKDTWYFFKGANIVLPREMYQKDVTKPLSFEKLHEIALKEVFSGYLMKKEPIVPFWKFWVEQEYEIDESWFDSHFDISDLGYDDDSQKRIFKQFKDSISQPFLKRDSFEEYYFKNISNPYLFK